MESAGASRSPAPPAGARSGAVGGWSSAPPGRACHSIIVSTGCAAPARTRGLYTPSAGPLHPWRQPCAPSGLRSAALCSTRGVGGQPCDTSGMRGVARALILPLPLCVSVPLW